MINLSNHKRTIRLSTFLNTFCKKSFTAVFYLTLSVLLSCNVLSQNALISIDEKNKDIGVVENIYKVKADYVIQNKQAKNLYLLRADAQRGITIRSSKKTIKPNDTSLIVVEFIPDNTGKFNQTINLVTSADGEPFTFSLSGNIKSIKSDDKTACYYFGKPNTAGVKNIPPIVVVENTKPRNTSDKIPDGSSTPTNHQNDAPKTVDEKPKDNPVLINSTTKSELPPTALDEKLYKPNNIIFLVDVSSSMKDTNKLKVMQEALCFLIENLRPQDKITFITYADSVKLLQNGVTGNQKDQLNATVKKLKAKGLTKGKKAILFGLDVALSHYLSDGNNQLILATDGKFRFYPDDQKLYLQKQGDKQVLLSTIAFGNDKEALLNLKEIAHIGKGNFIQIKNRSKAKEQLLNEIKTNSLIN